MLDKIKNIIHENTFVDLDILNKVDNDEDLTNLGLDSINVVYVIGDIEENFGIVFNPEDLLLDNFSTYNKIISLLKKYKVYN
ncbi:acyl carrier protein [Clostridioides difficile]|jgi:phosphopantetheine-binding|uniref:acyl carrier protein n=1 Tax=Clostridioides difficile TaxID=1496 RepID=UPI0003B28B75|nr:acyl carrier protein [Clostridioides difficile]CCL50728.1 Phosphopantetheine-binding [Clostridioides difficile T6]